MGDHTHVEIGSSLWFIGWIYTWGYVGWERWQDVALGILNWAWVLGQAVAAA